MTEPTCERTLRNYDAGHLTGFTRRAAQALIHLADAWNVADGANTPGIVCAIWHVLHTRSCLHSRGAYEELLYLQLGDHGAGKLLAELQLLDDARTAD